MAKPKKKREKKYHPKEVSMRPALLKKMTLGQKVVQDSVDTMRTALMRLKLHNKLHRKPTTSVAGRNV